MQALYQRLGNRRFVVKLDQERPNHVLKMLFVLIVEVKVKEDDWLRVVLDEVLDYGRTENSLPAARRTEQPDKVIGARSPTQELGVRV